MCLLPVYAWRCVYLSSNRTCVHCASHPTIIFLAEFDQCASSPCMHGGVCTSHPTGPVHRAFHPTICFLTEFDQCASSPCMHGGVCASHPTGPVCNCTGTDYGGKYCHTSKCDLCCFSEWSCSHVMAKFKPWSHVKDCLHVAFFTAFY